MVVTENDSIPMKGLLVLGVLFIILAGFDDSIPPRNYLELYLPYFLLIGGIILIVVSIVLMLRKR